MTWLVSPLRVLVFITVAVPCLYGCISIGIERTSTGDFDAEERLKKAIDDILKDSERLETRMLSGQAATNDTGLIDVVQRHFSRANDIVVQHAASTRKAIPFVTFDDYLEKRRSLLDFTLRLEPSFDVLESEVAYAIAFPSGRIVLSQPLAKSFDGSGDGYNGALLGVLIHELVHVRDGHAIEQWATADGRNTWVADKALGALAHLTYVFPFWIKYDIGYEVAFKSAKQLPKLSEFAADLGAVSLLEDSGFEKGDYIGFLNSVYSRSRTSAGTSAGTSKEPFSWMSDRLECLRSFDTAYFVGGLSEIRVGSTRDGDKTISDMDLTRTKRISDGLNNPEELRKEYESRVELSDARLKEVALREVQRTAFTVCAIQKTFPSAQVVDGVLRTPGFDLSMFRLHY